jgi:hypothetical protein
MRRVRFADGRYGFVSPVQDAIGDMGGLAESASLTAALNQAAANGDRDEVARIQALIEEQANKRLNRG